MSLKIANLLASFLLLVVTAKAEVNFELFGNFIYEEGEWETMIVDLISREIPTLPLQDFVDNPELEQKVDRVNKLSVYKRLKGPGQQGELSEDEEEARIVYRRKSVDSKSPVVVLRSNEDHLKIFERKRTFVVLRQNPLTNKTYFASYIYLRFWTDRQEGCKETYLNEKICLEFDTWDNDRGEVKTSQKYFGWTDCASSFLFSCRFTSPNETQKNTSGNQQMDLSERGNRNTSLNYEDPSAHKLEFKHAESVPFDDTIDVFFDLEATPGEGRYIRETVKHTSIFNKPEAFLGNTGAISQSGRSLGNEESAAESSKVLSQSKEKAKHASETKTKNKAMIHSKLSSRTEWFKRKNELNNLIRMRAKELGFKEYYKVKSDEKKMAYLKQYKNTSELFKELEELGENYTENEISKNSMVEESNSSTPDKKKKATILAAADVTHMQISGHGHAEENSPSAAFGLALSSVVQGSGAMSGRSLGAVDTKVAQNIAKSVLFSSTDTFQIPGWKLQEVNESLWKDNITLRHESIIFYGLGSCPFKENNDTFPQNDSTEGNATAYQEQVVNFHLTLLRTYCLEEAREYLSYLLDDGYLKINKGIIMLVEDIPLFKKRKLRADEFRILSASVEISSFSQNYVEELDHEWDPKEYNISRSVHFLQELGLLYLKKGRKLADQHFIKLCRSFVLSLKGVMTKLLQDNEILFAKCHSGPTENATTTTGKSKPCEKDFDMNHYDLLGIYSLMEFFMRGLSPVEMSRVADVDEIFHKFITDNDDTLRKGLDFFN